MPSGETGLLAVDLETRGNDPSDPEFAIMGAGFADASGCWYLDWRSLDQESRDYLAQQLKARPLTAFNVLFDGMALEAAGLGWLNWVLCSFGLFRQLTTEGYTGQRWNLAALQRDVLGWPDSNKDELGELLAKHGLKKEDMWKLADLEPESFGLYCAVDAEAHWQGFWELVEQMDNLGPSRDVLRQYHKEEFLTLVRLLSEQQLRGLTIDVPRLRAYRDTLVTKIDDGLREFLAHPLVAPVVAEYNAQVVTAHCGKEPPRTNADGSQSVRWEKWDSKWQLLQTENHFNPGSRPQLAWLFYDKLGMPVRKYTDGGKSGKPMPSVDKEVLPFLGEPGKILSRTRKTEKLLTYVDACLGRQRDGVLHPPMKSVGALTGRLSGGDTDD